MKNFVSKSVILITFLAFLGCSSESLVPCVPVSCKNGGISTSDCNCSCPINYTGYACSFQKEPTKINISKIEIVNFPKIDPSAQTGYWDYTFLLGSSQYPPDLAIIFSGLRSQTVYSDTTNNPFMNAQNQIYSYTYNNFSITNVNDIFTLELRDIDDNNTFQIMDTYTFSLYNATNGFPSVISLNNGLTQYRIYVSYTW